MSSDALTLQTIASAYLAGQTSAWDAASQGVQALMNQLRCSRVSLWRFEIHGDTRGLRCIAHALAGGALVPDTTVLCADQYREYFAVLVRTGTFVANDVRSEPGLREMRGIFLDTNGIGALMDVALTINGRAYGVVCCEQIPGPRQWEPHDVVAARGLVARAALLMASKPSLDLTDVHSMAMEPLDSPSALRQSGNDRRNTS